MASSRGVVIAAMIANGGIAVLKFFGFLLTGSPSMLSETYHSISDTGNQVFLLVGIRYGGRDPTRSHPFGYGKAQFFYSFLVSVLLFGIAGWESTKHGYDAIMHPHEGGTGAVNFLWLSYDPSLPFDPVYVNYAVLLGAILFESYAFRKAYANMRGQMERYDWGTFRQAFRETSDVTVLTALTEDTIAMAGAGIALVGVFLTEQTGNHIYDAVSALIIGLMLMGFALALAWENKRLLIGESLPREDEAALLDVFRNHEAVRHVDEFRTVYFGPERIIVTADVTFAGDHTADSLDDDITEIEEALMAADERVRKVYVEPEVG